MPATSPPTPSKQPGIAVQPCIDSRAFPHIVDAIFAAYLDSNPSHAERFKLRLVSKPLAHRVDAQYARHLTLFKHYHDTCVFQTVPDVPHPRFCSGRVDRVVRNTRQETTLPSPLLLAHTRVLDIYDNKWTDFGYMMEVASALTNVDVVRNFLHNDAGEEVFECAFSCRKLVCAYEYDDQATRTFNIKEECPSVAQIKLFIFLPDAMNVNDWNMRMENPSNKLRELIVECRTYTYDEVDYERSDNMGLGVLDGFKDIVAGGVKLTVIGLECLPACLVGLTDRELASNEDIRERIVDRICHDCPGAKRSDIEARVRCVSLRERRLEIGDEEHELEE